MKAQVQELLRQNATVSSRNYKPLSSFSDDERLALLAKARQRYKKAEALIRSMFERKVDLPAALNEGINPYKTKKAHAYMSVVVDELLQHGRFTKSRIVDRLETEMDWTHGTAVSHAATAIHALSLLGILEDQSKGHHKMR